MNCSKRERGGSWEEKGVWKLGEEGGGGGGDWQTQSDADGDRDSIDRDINTSTVTDVWPAG